MHMVYFTQRNTHTRTSVSKDKYLITFQTGTEENKMSPSFKGLIKAISIWADELSKQTKSWLDYVCSCVSYKSGCMK